MTPTFLPVRIAQSGSNGMAFVATKSWINLAHIPFVTYSRETAGNEPLVTVMLDGSPLLVSAADLLDSGHFPNAEIKVPIPTLVLP